MFLARKRRFASLDAPTLGFFGTVRLFFEVNRFASLKRARVGYFW